MHTVCPEEGLTPSRKDAPVDTHSDDALFPHQMGHTLWFGSLPVDSYLPENHKPHDHRALSVLFTGADHLPSTRPGTSMCGVNVCWPTSRKNSSVTSQIPDSLASFWSFGHDFQGFLIRKQYAFLSENIKEKIKLCVIPSPRDNFCVICLHFLIVLLLCIWKCIKYS